MGVAVNAASCCVCMLNLLVFKRVKVPSVASLRTGVASWPIRSRWGWDRPYIKDAKNPLSTSVVAFRFSSCGGITASCSRRRVSQRIAPFVIEVTGVSLDMYPVHLVVPGQLIQFLPEIPVRDRLPGGALPSVRLPSRKELRDSAPHVLRVRQHGDAAGPFQCPQSLDCGDQFHAIVGRVRRTSLQHALAFSAAQDARPASGSRVAEARTIGDNFDFAQITSGNCGHTTPPFKVMSTSRGVTGNATVCTEREVW